MNKKELKELFGDDLELLKKNKNLNNLLKNLSFSRALNLIKNSKRQTYLRVLENEQYFESQLDFERELYPLLLDSDEKVWKRLANDNSLSFQARLRSAYLYVYLSKVPFKLKFDFEKYRGNFSFFHKAKGDDGDGYARLFGLKNGLDNMRFNQFKNTGSF